MKFTIGCAGVITCQHDNCGSCRVQQHGLHHLLPGDTLFNFNGEQLCPGCGKSSTTVSEGEELAFGGMHEHCRKIQAARIATRFGMIDGDHHKQWVIDQMLRAILGDNGYKEWVQKMNSDPDYEPWDVGIAP
jgi:hypothetical protein